MWYDFLPGMVLSPGDEVRATPYNKRTIVECELVKKEHNYWIATDLECPEEMIQKCIGDPSRIKLTEDMILRVWRE